MGPHPNQKQAFDLWAVFDRGQGPDRSRLGHHQTVIFKFNTKYLYGIGVEFRFAADLHAKAVAEIDKDCRSLFIAPTRSLTFRLIGSALVCFFRPENSRVGR